MGSLQPAISEFREVAEDPTAIRSLARVIQRKPTWVTFPRRSPDGRQSGSYRLNLLVRQRHSRKEIAFAIEIGAVYFMSTGFYFDPGQATFCVRQTPA